MKTKAIIMFGSILTVCILIMVSSVSAIETTATETPRIEQLKEKIQNLILVNDNNLPQWFGPLMFIIVMIIWMIILSMAFTPFR